MNDEAANTDGKLRLTGSAFAAAVFPGYRHFHRDLAQHPALSDEWDKAVSTNPWLAGRTAAGSAPRALSEQERALVDRAFHTYLPLLEWQQRSKEQVFELKQEQGFTGKSAAQVFRAIDAQHAYRTGLVTQELYRGLRELSLLEEDAMRIVAQTINRTIGVFDTAENNLGKAGLHATGMVGRYETNEDFMEIHPLKRAFRPRNDRYPDPQTIFEKKIRQFEKRYDAYLNGMGKCHAFNPSDLPLPEIEQRSHQGPMQAEARAKPERSRGD